MNIYRILDEDGKIYRIVKDTYERDRLLSLDSRFKCDTIVCTKLKDKKTNSFTWAYNKVGEALL